jgi:hypothetical protein
MVCVYQMGVFMVSAVCFLWCAGKRDLTQLLGTQVILELKFSFLLFMPTGAFSHIHKLRSTLAGFRADLSSSDNRYTGEAA